MKRLLETMPQVGRVEWIGVRPTRSGEMQVVGQVAASCERGLDGDRFDGGITARINPGRFHGNRRLSPCFAYRVTSVRIWTSAHFGRVRSTSSDALSASCPAHWRVNCLSNVKSSVLIVRSPTHGNGKKPSSAGIDAAAALLRQNIFL